MANLPDWPPGRFQVLALDGGGIRGLYTASLLGALEKGIGRPIVDHFDLIAGTSTGGIIALGLAKGLTNYGDRDFSVYLRKSFASSMGYSREMLAKKVIGIAYTPSGFNNCHRHFTEMLEAVKRGVLAAGALPIEFPTISLGEV